MSDDADHGGPAATRRGMSPAGRLAAAAFALLLAVCALGAVLSVRSYADQRDRILDETQVLAAGAAANTDSFVEGRIQVLNALAADPAFRAADLRRIDSAMRRVRPAARGFSGTLGWIDPSGVVRADTSAATRPIDVSDRAYVRDVLRTGRPAVSDGVIGRRLGVPIVALAVPTFDAAGRVNGVLSGSFRLDELGAAQAALRVGGSDVRIVGRDGNVIVEATPVTRLRPAAAPSRLAGMRAAGQGALDSPGGFAADRGRDRLVGFATAPGPGWLVLVERPRETLLSGPRRAMAIELAALVSIAVTGGIALLLITRRLARSGRRAERARRRAEALRRLSGDLLADVDDAGIVQAVHRTASGVLGCTGLTVTLTAPPDAPRRLDAGNAPGEAAPGEAYRPRGAVVLRGEEVRAAVRAPVGEEPDVVVATPLRVDGTDTGWMLLRWDAPDPPGSDELDFVVLLAITTAQALQRARLFREERAARSRIQALQRITATLSAAATSEEVFREVAPAAGRAVGAAYCSVGVVTPDGRGVRVVGRYGPPRGRPDELPLDGDDPLAMVIREQKALFRDGGPGAPPVERLAALPLLDRGRPLGAMLLAFGDEAPFDAEDIRQLTAVARHAAQALTRASHLDSERRARARAEALQDAGARLDGAGDMDAVRRVTADALVALGALTGRIEAGGGSGGPPPAPEAHARRAAAVASALQGTATFPGGPEPAWAAMPLRLGGRTIGAIIALLPEPDGWDDDARRALLTLADMVAQAVDRIRLHERERVRLERAELLARVGSELLRVDGAHARLRRLAELVVPQFADFATVERPGADGRFDVVAAVHRDPGGEELLLALRHGHRLDPDQPYSVAGVYASGRPYVLEDIPPALVDDAGAAASGALRSLGLTSCVAVPLRAGGASVGVLLLGLGRGARRYGQDDLTFAVDLADRAGIAVERAELYARQQEIAHELQRSMLGADPVSGDDVTVAARYRAGESGMEIGGDWHDVIRLPGGRVAATVGDVVGRGLTAAAAMGRARSALAALATVEPAPSVVLDRLEGFGEALDGVRLATVAYVLIEPGTRRVRYACAGHPPPLAVHADGSAEFLWGGRSAPVGAATGHAREEEYRLPEGSTLVLYSDGLFERRGETVDAGLERLRATAASLAREDVDGLADGLVTRMLDGASQDDDAVVLVLRLAGARAPGFSMRFPARPEELSRMRRAAREWLAGAGVEGGLAADLVLAVGEAAANAVEHAYPPGATDASVEVRMHRSNDAIRVLVADHGRWRDPPAPGPRGRGMRIMSSLVDDVAVRRGRAGTRVRLRRRVGTT